MENIQETYDKLLKAGDLSEENNTDQKLTDSQIEDISGTLNKVVEENANLKVIANLPSNNGILESESTLVGEDKLVNVKVNPVTHEKTVVGIVEEDNNELATELFEDILDDNVDGVNIDDIELRKEVVEKTISEKFNKEFNETEVIQLVNLLNEYRKDKTINVYSKLPKSLQRMIDTMVAKEGVPFNAMANIKKSISREMLDDLIFDTTIDNYQIEFNEEIENVFNGVKEEFRDMSVKMTKEQIEKLISIEPELREKDEEKADRLLKIIDGVEKEIDKKMIDDLFNLSHSLQRFILSI